MGSGADSRPIMGVMGIISLVVFVVCTILYGIALSHKEPGAKGQDKREIAAVAIGAIMTLAWTGVLWPIMTGGGSGAYVVYVNGVASSGGTVNFFYGFVPLFIGAVVLVALPRGLAYGIHKLRQSGKSNAAGKRSVPALVVSIVATLASWIFLGAGISLVINRPQDIEPAGIISVFVIGAIVLALGIRGIVHFVRAK